MCARALRQTITTTIAVAFRTVVISLAIYGGLDLIRNVMAQDDESVYLPAVAKAAQVESLENRVAALEYKLQNVTASTDAITVTGANLHVVNGAGSTETTNGLGNVIVGYNEPRVYAAPTPFSNVGVDHSGSHMLVVGSRNSYRSFGGIVVGKSNTVGGEFSAATGGTENYALGPMSSVTGGSDNRATGARSAVSGGVGALATGAGSSISGGRSNKAEGRESSVCGGVANRASGTGAAVSGGWSNVASGWESAVSGGRQRTAPGEYSWAAGSLLEPQ